MRMKTTATALLCAALLAPTLAEGQHCRELKTSVKQHLTQAENPLASSDQARLAELLRPATQEVDPVDQIRAQVLAKRESIDQQFTSLTQPRMIDESTHYSIRHLIKFTHHHHGSIHQFRVKGTTHGNVWGTDTYTSDSHLGAAAVHAGVLKPDQTGTVTIRVVEPLPRFDGHTRYGVHSRSWHHDWDGAYEFVTDTTLDSLFVTADLTRLRSALNHAEPIDPAQAIRQSVLSNRAKANKQLQAVLAAVAEAQTEQETLTVIDSRSERVHTHGRQYWIAVGLISNGELRTQVAIAQCNGHGYDLHQVNNIQDTPHAVQRYVQQLNHELLSTFPDHSPELAALTWRVRQAISEQRAETEQQYAALVEWISTQPSVPTSTQASQ